MTNDEIQKKSKAKMANRAFAPVGIWHLSFRTLSSFGIRHLAFLRLCLSLASAAEPPGADFTPVQAIFDKHCLDCHAANEPEGKLVLESFDTLVKGGELGGAIVPGKSAESLLVQMIEGRFEKEGKKKIMPPGKR